MKSLNTILFLVAITLVSCNKTKETSEISSENILLQEWTGPFGGVPAFDQMNLEDIKPAFEKAMELNLAEIDVLTSNTEDPTFENTIVPMEKAGSALNRISRYYGIWSANVSSPEFRKIQGEMAPILSEFRSKISQNEALFKRVKTVYDNSLKSPLEDDQQRVVLLTYEGFAMSGAELDSVKKKRYAAINKELSSKYTKFANNILADEENYVVYLEENQLTGSIPSTFSGLIALHTFDVTGNCLTNFEPVNHIPNLIGADLQNDNCGI